MSKITYSEKLKDPRWQRKRLEVFTRDNFTCRDCGDTSKTLHVHHCHYQKGNPWDTDLRFLLSLCSECHEERQALEDDAKMMLGMILSKTPLYGSEAAPTELRDFVSSLAQITREAPTTIRSSSAISATNAGDVEVRAHV